MSQNTHFSEIKKKFKLVGPFSQIQVKKKSIILTSTIINSAKNYHNPETENESLFSVIDQSVKNL